MRMAWLLIVLLGAACAPTSVTGEPADPAPEQIEAGQRLAAAHCQRCHAVAADAASPNADAPPLARLSERYPVTVLADAFPQRMRVGHPAMPEFRFADDEIADLLAYLQTIQARQGA